MREMQDLLTGDQPHKVPQLPDGMAIYAVGDIHGRADLLKQTFTLIDSDIAATKPTRTIEVFLGDYIDRGPASKETIDLLIDRGITRDAVFLRGNHETMLQRLLGGMLDGPNLRSFGLLQTLRSYGIASPLNPDRKEEIALIKELKTVFPDKHQKFLESLRPSFSCGDFFFVHAGVRPGIPLERQDENDLIWIRDEFLNFTGSFGKYVVHGHTPVQKPDIRSNRINIDTGAYATNNLTTIKIQRSHIAILQDAK